MRFWIEKSDIGPILEWVRGKLKELGAIPKSLYHMELATEEIVSNIYKHGYKGKKGEIEITILPKPPLGIKIRIQDEAIAFNPWSIEEVDPSLSLEERKIGGLGIHLAKACVDEVFYERCEGKNITTLIKKNAITPSSSHKR